MNRALLRIFSLFLIVFLCAATAAQIGAGDDERRKKKKKNNKSNMAQEPGDAKENDGDENVRRQSEREVQECWFIG